MEIRALRDSDDRAGFRSSDADLDRFLKQYAGQNQFRHHIGTTYVAADNDRILGYATVAPGHIEIEDLPHALRRRLPKYPLPILRLARLSVDLSTRGQGVGKELLRFVLNLARRMAADYGCLGVVVDAKPAAVKFYQRFGFLELRLIEGQSPARPVSIVLFLAIREVEEAAAGNTRSTTLR